MQNMIVFLDQGS